MAQTPSRLTPVLLALALAAGCVGSGKEPPRGALTRITETGELRVGMSGEQPPLNMVAKSGELIGLEVALVRVLAQSMGVEARLVQRPFPELLDALERGDVDMVMSGLTITPQRSRRVALVGPYFTSGKTLLTRSESLANVQIAEDLDNERLRFAALKGSTSESFARRELSRAKLVTVERLSEGIQKVVKGEVDALVADQETGHFAALRFPDAGLYTSAVPFTVEPMGIAVRQEDESLANLLRAYLTSLANQGTLERARRFWFEDPSWVEELR